MATLIGNQAIEAAVAHGLRLNKYEDPTEDAREGLSVAEAREVAAQDPSLIWVEAESRYEQAISGLHIRRGGGVVAINDGAYRWLVSALAWDAAKAALEGEGADASDEGGAEAYSQLCSTVASRARAMGVALVTDVGESVGSEAAQQALVQAAAGAGLPMTARQDGMLGA